MGHTLIKSLISDGLPVGAHLAQVGLLHGRCDEIGTCQNCKAVALQTSKSHYMPIQNSKD